MDWPRIQEDTKMDSMNMKSEDGDWLGKRFTMEKTCEYLPLRLLF